MRDAGQLTNCHSSILLAWSWVFFLLSSVVRKGKCNSSPACSVLYFFVFCGRIQEDSVFLTHPDALNQMLRKIMERVFS